MRGHDAHEAAGRLHVALHCQVDGLDLVREAGERGGCVVFVIERQRHEFVERVAGLRTEPREERVAPAFGSQDATEEVERLRIRTPSPAFYARSHRLVARVAGIRERGGEAARPPRRDRDQIVVGQAAERRFEDAGERQVVVGRERRARGGDEIHDGDMSADVEPIGAGDRDADLLQRAHQRFEQRAAPAHEDHDVVWPDRPQRAGVGIPHALARTLRRERRNLARDAAGEFDRRVGRARQVDRQSPAFGIGRFFASDRAPDFDQAGRVFLQRVMVRRQVGLDGQAA